MKHIKIYINEKLHITTKSHLYSCKPKTKDELCEIISQRIKENGPKCDLNDIDVSKITDMSHLFDAYYNDGQFKDFNGDISNWDVSNVISMRSMFSGCEKFNCDIRDWDVSNVNIIDYMFSQCMNFKQNLDDWNISSYACNMTNAFYNCPTEPEWYDRTKWE